MKIEGKIKKYILVSFLFSLSSLIVYGQNSFIGRQVFAKPLNYVPPNGPTGVVLNNSRENVNEKAISYWEVYSDRNNNRTFEKPDLNAAEKEEMGFMQCFFVIGEDKDKGFVELIAYDLETIDNATRKIIKQPKYYGWAPKSKLLLWNNSLINKTTRFTKKALAIHQLEALKKPQDYVEKENVKLYDSPNLTEKNRNKNKLRLYNFLYLFKEEDDRYLIGKKDLFHPDEKDEIIVGWVPKGIIQIWDQRQCLIPNNDASAATERSASKLYAAVFENKEEAVAYSHSKVLDEKICIWSEKNPSKKYDGEWKRYPILNDENGIITTGFITAVMDTNGRDVVPILKQNEILKEVNDQIEKTNRINVIFIVDGTGSMKNYFQAVNSAINKTTAHLESNSKGHTFKYGAVIYRDYMHETCPQGDLSCQVNAEGLTSDKDNITNFFTEKGKETECGNDPTLAEAMYMGVSKGIDLLKKEQEKETNILIIIGDAGNHYGDKKFTKEALVEKATKYKCSFFSMRVNSGTDPTYEEFRMQIKQLMESTAKNVYNYSFGKPLPDGNNLIKALNPTEFKLQNAPIEGSLSLNKKNEIIKPELLSEQIYNFILNQNNIVKDCETKVEDLMKGQGPKDIPVTPRMRLLLKNAGVNLDDSVMRAYISKYNFQFCLNTFTPIQSDHLENSFFKYNLFVSQDEYSQLKTNFAKIVKADNGIGDLREELYQGYMQILKTYYGDEESQAKLPKKYDNKTLDEIQQLVVGIKAQNPLFKKKLKDLMDSGRTKPLELHQIAEAVRAKLKKLEDIETDPLYYTVNSGRRYYWIPADFLP